MRQVWICLNSIMKKTAEQPGITQGARAYTPYGNLSAVVGAALGFNGEWNDAVMRSYALGNGHRFYSPALMRFYSPDGFSPFGKGGVNAFVYCSGDPVNRTDPSANASVLWLRALKAVRVSRTLKVIKDFESRSIGRLPDEMIEKIVNYLPLKETHAFSQTSKRMYELAWQGTPQLHLKMQTMLQAQPSESHRLIEVKKIAAGNGQMPARAMLGTHYNQQKVDLALTNPNQSEAYNEAASIRANRGAAAFRLEWFFGLFSVRVE